MVITSAADLVFELKKHTLLKATQLDEITRILPGRSSDPQALTKELLDRGWLTEYQVKLLLQGRGHHLVMGPFLLLDRIGEGGMGEVFKAQHQGLKRIVALKVLRRELINDSDAVARFYREIKVTSQLPPHPNLVRVYDAGPLGQSHFLAMEFVEGCDLQRLVKEKGPLSVIRACDCLRQAALGLQHAHERGLVHRDIKPANLFMGEASGESSTRSDANQLVKVLDLGLARLQHGGNGSCRENTLLTTDGPVTMGTVDYQAPEQALDFHKADIRADIYSLGCTSYYLLTGKTPFGSGALVTKLMRHQQAEPPNLKERRPEVPDALLPIIRRMLAKRPEDRFQTPAEVAQVLAPFVDSTSRATIGSVQKLPAGLPGFGKRRLGILVGAGGLILTGLVLALFFFAKSSGSERAEKSFPTFPVTLPTSNSATTVKSSRPSQTISWVSNGKPYDVVPAKVGALLYIDRPYTITSLSPTLDGGTMIRSANDDKKIAAAEHLKFTLHGPADVYVAYDTRATQLPPWLNDGSWQRTTEKFRAKDAGGGELDRIVFRKRFPMGQVALGGNSQKPAVKADTHYVVIVRP